MRAVGIILAGGNSKKMKELSLKRAIAAMPMAGSYRAIDFALSNMTNSHIQKVAVLTQYNALSLNEHLSSSKWWDFGRKQGGIYVYAPTITASNSFWYRGTADAIAQNIDFLKKSHEPYVVIATGDTIYKLNYNKVLQQHVDTNADITIVCKEFFDGEDVSRFGVVKIDEDKRITDFEEKPLEAQSNIISTGVYVIRRRLLIEMIEQCMEEGKYDIVNDVIVRNKNQKKVYAYMLETYWSNIATVQSYFDTNMAFLKDDFRRYFLQEHPDIYSKVDDLPPAKYNPGANVKNSLVSSGSIINGTVENSLIFKKAYVGNNCTIKNSIILNDVYIDDGAYIENCIVESHSTIRANESFVGEEGNIKIVIERNDRFDL